MSDWTPDPLESGWLEPPKKPPRTAVGVATPPPPRGPHRQSSRAYNPLRKIGVMFVLATAATSMGVIAGMTIPMSALLEIGAGLSALELAAHVARHRRRLFRRRARAA